MYLKAVYKNSIYAGTEKDKEKVINDFLTDIKNIKPVNVKKNKTRLFVCFDDGKYLCLYTLPLSYEKYVKGEK